LPLLILIVGGCLVLGTDTQEPGNSKKNEFISRTLEQFYNELESPDLTSEERAVVIDQIANYKREQSPYEMVSFLTQHVAQNPDDPYNAYYLLKVADFFQTTNNLESAFQLYYRILKNYPDVIWQNQSVYYLSLIRSIEINLDPRLTAEYLEQLIQEFPNKIDLGSRYLRLAGVYEEIGEYEQAYDSFEAFLKYPDTVIPGKPDIDFLVREKVAFHHSSKSWIRHDLDDLVRDIKNALWSKNGWALLRYQAKVNFFAMTWIQERQDHNSRPDFELIEFLTQARRITYAADVEYASNGREAFLRTQGWSPRIPTWFLYFRRIDYPADPSVNGSWEWAGIFFGEPI
jgi:tetratricopeptide (TPR) repeat protein